MRENERAGTSVPDRPGEEYKLSFHPPPLLLLPSLPSSSLFFPLLPSSSLLLPGHPLSQASSFFTLKVHPSASRIPNFRATIAETFPTDSVSSIRKNFWVSLLS
jgi:hypothetical protein